MSWNIEEADEFIKLNTLDNEDWFDSDEDRKIALLNVSKRTLENKFPNYEIPIEAVYIFANVLSYNFNDTTKLAQRGIASFSIRGISFTFKDWALKELHEFIPDEIYNMIGAPKRRAKFTVM